MTVSTTSFTVPPSALRIVFTSASDVVAQPQRRCGPIGPFSDDSSFGETTLASVPAPVPRVRRFSIRRWGARAAERALRKIS